MNSVLTPEAEGVLLAMVELRKVTRFDHIGEDLVRKGFAERRRSTLVPTQRGMAVAIAIRRARREGSGKGSATSQ
jgi:hypothetical protein